LDVAEKEIGNAFDVGTAMARQLCYSAEQQGVSLQVDVCHLESHELLQQAAALHMTAVGAALSKPKLQPMVTRARVGVLPSMQTTSVGSEESAHPGGYLDAVQCIHA
jgi:hypothetical protein